MNKLKFCPIHKVVSLEYPLINNYYCEYLFKEEINSLVIDYFKKFNLFEFDNFSIDFDTGLSGNYCYLEFPWEMPDDKIEEICKKVINFLHDEEFIEA